MSASAYGPTDASSETAAHFQTRVVMVSAPLGRSSKVIGSSLAVWMATDAMAAKIAARASGFF